MRFLFIVSCFILSFTSVLFAQQNNETTQKTPYEIPGVTSPYADIVIWGGAIYTGEENTETVEAIAITSGRFSIVGDTSSISQWVGPNTEIIDLKGNSLFPGFTDGHAHLGGIGARELTLNLESTASIEDLLINLSNWIDSHDESVITGRGWIETHWPEERFPSRWDLDRVAPSIAVILTRADGHALVANSAAIKAAGITQATTAPFGGEIERNTLGEATGIFIDEAMSLFNTIRPLETPEKRDEKLIMGAQVYASRGWTGLHNMSVSLEDAKHLETLSANGDIMIRVYNSVNQDDAETLISEGPSRGPNGRIITQGVKLYVDGALGSRGAALLAPYADAPTSGLITLKKDDALSLMTRALETSIQINTHAIGDRGNRLVLDWIEEALANTGRTSPDTKGPRFRIEHAQILEPSDIRRFKSLNVIPSMQPSHAIGDLHFAPDRLGNERLTGAYAWRQLIDSGVIIAGGSDAPVEDGNPLTEFYAATARRDLNGYQSESWNPNEVVTRSEALKMFTLWPAIASFSEDRLGTIKVGKQADLTAFNIDLMTVDLADIPKGKAVLTVVDGTILYDAITSQQ